MAGFRKFANPLLVLMAASPAATVKDEAMFRFKRHRNKPSFHATHIAETCMSGLSHLGGAELKFSVRIPQAEGRPRKPELPKDYKAPEDLEDRLILPLLNESVAALHDGVVADADLLDAGVIFGTGFAPFRGGPIAHIRAVGADNLVARLKALQAKYGDRFAPRPGWDSDALRG